MRKVSGTVLFSTSKRLLVENSEPAIASIGSLLCTLECTQLRCCTLSNIGNKFSTDLQLCVHTAVLLVVGLNLLSV